MQPITLGRAVNSSVEVVSGLVAGDDVVAHGSFLLKAEMLKSEMVAE
jgi:multidrug efflux pump subunit AcrA (membrane-fusion protein)